MEKGFGANKAPRPSHSPGGAAGEHSLSGAVDELKKQHPQDYMETAERIVKSHNKINKRPFSPGPGY